ncbi:unnamed protein product [Prorocentrum cordatum]|uniref:CSD domain-containing protein n=1 Tax=Prorocentrum cordatum TaxID=2364126 RepID=A0ABN9QLY9_9DINO|nr:unnamed protein product [Polarella glacialis]
MPRAPAAAADMGARVTGTVLWFNIEKGFGHIVPDADASQRVFARENCVIGNVLRAGDHVTYAIFTLGNVAVDITGGTSSSSTREACTPPRSEARCVTPRAPRKRARNDAA